MNKESPALEQNKEQSHYSHLSSSTQRRAIPSRPRAMPGDYSMRFNFDFTTALIHADADMVRRFTGNLSTGLKGLKFPGLNPQVARTYLIQFVREQVEQAGVKSVIMGISGGLDSAVVAYLLIEALGRASVHFVHFIETDRSSLIRARADLITRALRCHLEMYDLRPILKLVFSQNPKASLPARKKRIARERMAALFDLAENKNARVIGSVNKTKFLLGFGTEFGDLAFAFNPIGDLYQTQVLEMARYMNIPKIILENVLKAFGPDGHPWQQNIERMWKEIDYYLYQIVDARISLSHLQKLGMHEEKLFWIYRHIRESAFQRVLPPLADVASAYVPRAGEL